MFKAINKQTEQEVIILDSQWEKQIDQLRSLDKQDLLCCQECSEPVRVRAGEIKRWHFAHKKLEDCQYGKESTALLHSRALLYRWLASKFGPALCLEKKLDNVDLPRAIDCWIEEDNRKIAYWIVDRSIKPAIRFQLELAFIENDIKVHWVFTYDMLRLHEEQLDTLLLTTTERELLQQTEYDEILNQDTCRYGRSLHYLDYKNERLITLRQLSLDHPPQIYSGDRKETTLTEMKIKKSGGELWHPGEYEKVQKRLSDIEARREPEKIETHDLSCQQNYPVAQKTNSTRSVEYRPTAKVSLSIPTCIFCNKQTTEYWFQDVPGKLCRCRACLKKGHTKPPEPIK
jgi:hypothetical protein